MNTTMNDQNLKNLDQVRAFLLGTPCVEFKPTSKQECYDWIQKKLTGFQYHHLCRKEKGEVIQYLQKMTGYSRQQLTRLIEQHRKKKRISLAPYERRKFSTTYTREDIILLAELDELHQTLSGPATKKLCERMFVVFKDQRYARLSGISIAHLYNLRGTYLYRNKYQTFTKTKRTSIPIGERRKPTPNGVPGYLRVDSVHQGDHGKIKGVYHINLVDEVTQWQIVCTVERINENFLIPALEAALAAFPFVIKGFHSDNGSEYINGVTATLLNNLLIEFTKSRARRTNDNALVESKNGAVIRKILGYVHLPQKYAPMIAQFNRQYLNPYLNYHRPCFFAQIKTDRKGKERKQYLYENMMTPYDKLKSLKNVAQYLKPGVTLKQLEAEAMSISDNEAAKRMKQARYKLFKQIFEQESLIPKGKR
jgi:transposase InsO family protein